MLRRIAALIFITSLMTPLVAAAADGNTATGPAANETAAADAAVHARLLALAREPQRPRALTMLYGSYATLQVMDIVTTRKAVGSGLASESNPLMGSGNTGRLIAMKLAGSAVSIYLAERMWKKNRVGAIVTMAAVNGITAAVVAHNAQIRH